MRKTQRSVTRIGSAGGAPPAIIGGAEALRSTGLHRHGARLHDV